MPEVSRYSGPRSERKRSESYPNADSKVVWGGGVSDEDNARSVEKDMHEEPLFTPQRRATPSCGTKIHRDCGIGQLQKMYNSILLSDLEVPGELCTRLSMVLRLVPYPRKDDEYPTGPISTSFLPPKGPLPEMQQWSITLWAVHRAYRATMP